MKSAAKYRHLGLKLTPQRLAILRCLDGNDSHPSADDIYRSVLKQFPTMSFATVYNTLEALKSRGNVQELKIDHTKKRYDPDSTAHHHMICSNCKKIVDVHKDFNLSLPDDMTEGFDVKGNSIEFYGICSKCK